MCTPAEMSSHVASSPPGLAGSPVVVKVSKSRSTGGSSSDTDAPKEIRTSEQSEDFMMNVYKLKLCPRR